MTGIHFANPWGAFALAAVPAIFAIHFLRERVRRVEVSTLFLLEKLPPVSPKGAVWHRLQSTPALWLQVLAALCGVWVLMQPRWVDSGVWRRMVLVVDDSPSMEACRERVQRELPDRLRGFVRSPIPTEWTVVAASAPQRPVYRGGVWADAWDAVSRCELVAKQADAHEVLSGMVQTRGAGGGTVVWVTDRLPERSISGVATLAFGNPVENVGWVGVRVWRESEQVQWEAMLRNWSDGEVRRFWRWEDAGGRSVGQELVLAGGEVRTVRGTFPEAVKAGALVLDADGFTFDDQLPLVAPVARSLAVRGPSGPWRTSFSRVVATLDGVSESSTEEAALVWVADGEETTLRQGQHAVVSARVGAESLRTGSIFAESDAWVSDGVWEGFLHAGTGAMRPVEGDRVLVWQGGEPLIWRGMRDGGLRLYLNFAVERSNADRVPAMILLLSRMMTEVQSREQGFSAVNMAGGELLPLVAGERYRMSVEGREPMRLASGIQVRAPYLGGRFRVSDASGQVCLEGAAYFGDAVEADLRGANSGGSLDEAAAESDFAQSVEDPYRDVWVCVAGLALFASWAAIGWSERRGEEGLDEV
jgi:hypothetical protein